MNLVHPMSCQDCQEHWSELLYAARGEPLDADLAAGLAAHLEACPRCAGELRELRQAQSWLDVLSDPPMPEGPQAPLDRGGQVRLYSRLAKLERRRDAWRYAALAAGVAAVALLVAMWWPRAGTVDRSTGLEAHQASSRTAIPAATQDWGPEFQRMAARLEEQGQVLRLLAAELRAVEGQQHSRLTELEKQAGNATKATELQALRVTAVQHDIDKLRQFLMVRTAIAQSSDSGSD
jgi:hypothetical protein